MEPWVRWSCWSVVLWLASVAVSAGPRDFLVDADWLAERLDDEKLVLLEVRYHPHRYFTVGHIPGAVQVQRFRDRGDNDTSPSMRFPSRQAFQATLRRWGVDDDSLIVVYDDARTALASRVVLIDARPSDMYTGRTVRNAVRGGHIPGALNVVGLDGTDGESHQWLDERALAELYAEIPRDRTVIVYCHDGFRMSLAWLQLRSLGYRDVRLYNGGWAHWGNALSLPVVEGDDPWGEAYAL